jgi:hypothetical protein
MNNSTVCTTRVRGIETPKKKYPTAEAAFHAAKKINSLPTTIHVFGEYKCLTCLRFHIGRTNKVIVRDITQDIYHQTAPEPAKDWIAEVVEVEPIKEPHDDFNWGNEDKKSIQKIDTYYDKFFSKQSLI